MRLFPGKRVGTASLWLCFFTPWSHSFSFLPPVGLGTSSTRRLLSIAGATTHDCVQSGACAFPSWTRRLGWPRTIATSGWRRGTEAQVSHASAGTSMHSSVGTAAPVWRKESGSPHSWVGWGSDSPFSKGPDKDDVIYLS